MQSQAAEGKAQRGLAAQMLLPLLRGREIFPSPEVADLGPSKAGGRDEGGVNF